MNLKYILYASHLKHSFGYEALSALLEKSQHNNLKSGLTGFLHIEDDIVLQYLEGPADTLAQAVERIERDQRHDQFTVLADGTISQRYFEGWQMALVESATLSLFDLMGVEARDIASVSHANPMDLISLLSANASFLRDRPSVA